jgi:hypothetical protein
MTNAPAAVSAELHRFEYRVTRDHSYPKGTPREAMNGAYLEVEAVSEAEAYIAVVKQLKDRRVGDGVVLFKVDRCRV